MAKSKVESVAPLTPSRRLPESVETRPEVAERLDRGRRARAETPLEYHGQFAVTTLRENPVDLLERQAASRVPDLVPVRYGRMVSSPFAFYRGAALVMAADLAATPNSGLRVQLCGDAHLMNFGFYASPERTLVFDANDFDETLPGPFEWDVKRLAASVEIAARSQSFSDKDRRRIVANSACAYREWMRSFATMTNQEVWYSRLDASKFLEVVKAAVPAAKAAKAEALLAKATTRDSMQAFNKLTHVVDGQSRIISDPPLIVPVEELWPGVEGENLYAQMEDLLAAYRESLISDRQHLLDQYRFVHLARKVVGVGSVGTRAWILLFEGLHSEDPLFLQAKEAGPSVLEQYAGISEYSNHGERVVAGQRLMQASSDIFLGWQRTKGFDGIERDFYMRQLKDWKASAEVEGSTPAGMDVYARACGATLARAHARSGDRVAIAAYLGKSDTFDQAMVDFSAAYADQNERDHATLRAAIDNGNVMAEEGI
jgi:uncharacterized protein (DUF2252 family)